MRTPLPVPVACLAAGLVLLTACGADAPGRAAPGLLRIAGPFEVHSLDPAADGEVFTRLQVSETLVTSDLTGRLAPGLATRWTPSPDRRTWELPLVAGARFHDGTPVTAEAAAAALRAAAEDAASPLADLPVRRIKAAGGAIRIELTRPDATLPAVLTHYSTAILAPDSYDDGGRVTRVIGTGPYRVESVELPASIRTTRFDGWRGARPAVTDVSFQAVGRPESRALLATSGQADIVYGLEPAGRQRVDAADGVRMESSLQPRTILIKANAQHPVLEDVRVRRALSLALDRASMADAVLRERELAATQLLPPSLTAWHPRVEPLVHDRAEAGRLLDEAGWRVGSGGVRARDGRQLRLQLLTYPDRPELPALATAVQAAAAEVGIALEVDVANSSEVPARHEDGRLELALLAKHFALVSDPLVDVAAVFAPGGAAFGVMNWRAPAVTDAVQALLRGATGPQAQRHRDAIVRTAHEQLPLIPVAWYRMSAAVNDRVQGFVMDPLETSWRLTDLRWAP